MPPTPTPTEAQIEKTREVAGESDYTFIETAVNTRNGSQWSRMLELLELWDQYPADDVFALAGGQDGVSLGSGASRESVRRTARLLLGLPEIRDASLTGEACSGALMNQFVF